MIDIPRLKQRSLQIESLSGSLILIVREVHGIFVPDAQASRRRVDAQDILFERSENLIDDAACTDLMKLPGVLNSGRFCTAHIYSRSEGDYLETDALYMALYDDKQIDPAVLAMCMVARAVMSMGVNLQTLTPWSDGIGGSMLIYQAHETV